VIRPDLTHPGTRDSFKGVGSFQTGSAAYSFEQDATVPPDVKPTEQRRWSLVQSEYPAQPGKGMRSPLRLLSRDTI